MCSEIYKEEDFYNNDGWPTESFKYCNYRLNESGGDYDEFALVDNALYPYVRLAKKRGNNHYPCGRCLSPATDGWFATLTNAERDKECPKIAWGIAAEFLANLKYDHKQDDYVLSKPNDEIILNYYRRYLNLYLEDHNGLRYSALTGVEKELAFIAEHEEVCCALWKKSESLKAYSQLYEYVEYAEREYERYINERKQSLHKHEVTDLKQINELRTIIQNGNNSIYIENHTGPIILEKHNIEGTCDNTIRDEAYFAGIEAKIIEVLDRAYATIDVCVAWFTNQNLQKKLLDKRRQGIAVRVITYDDVVNKNYGVDLSKLDHKAVRGERGGILHDKFCVIDNTHTIVGSYNWTINAENKNDEDAFFHFDDYILASSFTKRFNEIWQRD